MSEYPSFEALREAHVEGRDFDRVIEPRAGASVAVIAPHGGRIEPRTDAIAAALAGDTFSLYCFISHLRAAEANLHITSHRFDDPECLALVGVHSRVVAVHGWANAGEGIVIGGLDQELVDRLVAESRAFGC